MYFPHRYNGPNRSKMSAQKYILEPPPFSPFLLSSCHSLSLSTNPEQFGAATNLNGCKSEWMGQEEPRRSKINLWGRISLSEEFHNHTETAVQLYWYILASSKWCVHAVGFRIGIAKVFQKFLLLRVDPLLPFYMYANCDTVMIHVMRCKAPARNHRKKESRHSSM